MIIYEDKTYNFLKITPDEGKVLTDWDKKDILKYSSSTLMYCPMNYDSSKLYEITVEEDKKYKDEQRKAYEAEEAKRK